MLLDAEKNMPQIQKMNELGSKLTSEIKYDDVIFIKSGRNVIYKLKSMGPQRILLTHVDLNHSVYVKKRRDKWTCEYIVTVKSLDNRKPLFEKKYNRQLDLVPFKCQQINVEDTMNKINHYEYDSADDDDEIIEEE
jgi:hypothetical protein